LEETAEAQIKSVCDQEFFAGSKIRIMPDVHGGMGCSIGTTMTITDKVVPGMVGVDIGCGMETVSIEEKSCDFEKLDRIIRAGIPSGRDVRATTHHLADEIDLSELRCASHVNQERARRSIGSLGGGNHFIEIDKSNYGTLYIVIHSGSRHIGNEVARYYQDEGFNALCGNAMFQINEMIALLKAEGREREIHDTLSEMRRERKPLRQIPHDLAYIEGSMFDDYIHDMKIIQRFAVLNRKAMMDVILSGMGFSAVEEFTTIHNYIDTDAMILRKGAVSAKTGEKLLIPINMRDGSLICIGKGNKEWNYSAPHGAGRIMSRKSAFKTLSMEQYKEKMAGIFTTCVNPDTLDESPMAYKEMGTIVKNIAPTVDIIDHVKPMYNFKACE
jgi:RNA-splicing ligase RtcB